MHHVPAPVTAQVAHEHPTFVSIRAFPQPQVAPILLLARYGRTEMVMMVLLERTTTRYEKRPMPDGAMA